MSRSLCIEIEELKTLIDNGLSSIEISRMIGVNQCTVSAILKRYGLLDYTEKLKENAKSFAIKKTRELVESKNIDFDIELSRSNSIYNLSTRYNISPQTVSKYLSIFRPDIYEQFVKVGKKNKSNPKVTDEDVSKMLYMSKKGLGINSIGKALKLDGTTIRRYLIKELGEEEYSKRHPTTKYTENKGWNGKRILYKGNVYQSNGEIEVAKILYSMNLKFELHKYITIKGKTYIPDFYVPSLDLYIEYAGMLQTKFYRLKFMKKVNDYSLNRMNFIVVNEENIEQLKDFICERRYT